MFDGAMEQFLRGYLISLCVSMCSYCRADSCMQPYLMMMQEILSRDPSKDRAQTRRVWLQKKQFSPESLGWLEVFVLPASREFSGLGHRRLLPCT